MGIRAVYIALTDEEADRLEALPDNQLVEELEKLQDKEDCKKVDIDKMWDSLHFVLTGITASEPIEDNPLSELVVGVYPIVFEDEFIAFSSKEDVQKIIKVVENIDFNTYRANFNPKILAQKEIYPKIWTDDKNDLFNEIKSSFDELVKFYQRNKDLNILTTIY